MPSSNAGARRLRRFNSARPGARRNSCAAHVRKVKRPEGRDPSAKTVFLTQPTVYRFGVRRCREDHGVAGLTQPRLTCLLLTSTRESGGFGRFAAWHHPCIWARNPVFLWQNETNKRMPMPGRLHYESCSARWNPCAAPSRAPRNAPMPWCSIWSPCSRRRRSASCRRRLENCPRRRAGRRRKAPFC